MGQNPHFIQLLEVSLAVAAEPAVRKLLKQRDAVAEGVIKTPYTFHDLRAKNASDNPDIEAAAKLLGHQNSQMTKSVYDRSVRLVQPLH